ncbi:hypothetical protein F0342_21465 [Bacillus sp. CH30_1T]|uniref:hypothetical protein n=1 Tax=Bacillus sp. CH30_1T TaxID=2604836 RepID=UPI0011EF8C29|nr:hypothetical protein [Bacillus sp. CH30_1T]KAA0560733.1 hypothetical protein F0342_21465 [Bacillus sp. CH30_1T]
MKLPKLDELEKTIISLKDFQELNSSTEIIILLIILGGTVLSLFPLFKKSHALLTMDGFERLVLTRKEKSFVDLLNKAKGPLVMLVSYFSYSILVIFLLGFLDINKQFLIMAVLLNLLICTLSFILLTPLILIKGLKNPKILQTLFFRIKIFKSTVFQLIIYINIVTTLFFYVTLIYFIFVTTMPQSIVNFLVTIFLPVGLYFLYNFVLKKFTEELTVTYYFSVLDNQSIEKDQLIFKYNLDGNRAVLVRESDTDCYVLYNFDSNSYYEYRKVVKNNEESLK